MRRTSTRFRGDDGAAATEMAIIAPAMLLLIMFLIQFGLWYHAVHVARAAADEAAKAARVESGTRQSGIDAANAFLDRAGDGLIVNRYVDVFPSPTSVRAEVSGDVISVLFGYAPKVEAVVESPKERFVPGG